jgi:methanogenic corrinoid protein MtbC1
MAITKQTSLPAVSIGFAISILVATWYAGARFRDMENRDVANTVLIEDIADRQRKYIGTSGLLTERLNNLTEQIHLLERELALLKVRLELGGEDR